MKTTLFFSILLTLLLNVSVSYSQKTGYLKLHVDVKDSLKNMVNSPDINVYEGDKKISKSNLNPFTIKLVNNKTFFIEISAPFLGKKTFIVDTKTNDYDFIFMHNFHVVLNNSTNTREHPLAKIYINIGHEVQDSIY
jgi:hypothetical protein